MVHYTHNQKLMNRGVEVRRTRVMYGQYMTADSSESKFSLTLHNWVKQSSAEGRYAFNIYLYI